MAALTLLEAADMAMGNDEVKRSAIIELFAYPDLLKVLPFMDVPGGSYTYTQEGQLPAWRSVDSTKPTPTVSAS
jgi:hypothetical protein